MNMKYNFIFSQLCFCVNVFIFLFKSNKYSQENYLTKDVLIYKVMCKILKKNIY